MQLGSPRRGLAAAISALFAMALAAAVAGRGCQNESDGPSDVVRSFIEHAREGDKAALFRMLGPESRERLRSAAARANELVGGERRYQPQDMLQPMRSGPGDLKIRTVKKQGDEALVSLTSSAGYFDEVRVVHIDDRWLIEISPGDDPLPQ